MFDKLKNLVFFKDRPKRRRSCIRDLSESIYKYNRWQQRNRPIIHDVTSVKYDKENEICSH